MGQSVAVILVMFRLGDGGNTGLQSARNRLILN